MTDIVLWLEAIVFLCLCGADQSGQSPGLWLYNILGQLRVISSIIHRLFVLMVSCLSDMYMLLQYRYCRQFLKCVRGLCVYRL